MVDITVKTVDLENVCSWFSVTGRSGESAVRGCLGAEGMEGMAEKGARIKHISGHNCEEGLAQAETKDRVQMGSHRALHQKVTAGR